jgi:hypothetical protein
LKNELEMLVERLKVSPTFSLSLAHLLLTASSCWLDTDNAVSLSDLQLYHHSGAYDVSVYACARVVADVDPNLDELNDLGAQAAQVPPPILRRARGSARNVARQPQVGKGEWSRSAVVKMDSISITVCRSS